MAEKEENSKSKGNGRVNRKDKQGNTALHIAVKSGHVDVLETLLKLGVRINEKNNKGETGLFMAVSLQMEEAVRCLVKNGGDIWAENEEGTSVWHAAAYSGNSVILDILANRLLESDRETAGEKSEAGVPGHEENYVNECQHTEDTDKSSGGKKKENIKEDSVSLVKSKDHKEGKGTNNVLQSVHTLKNSEFKTSDLGGTKQCDTPKCDGNGVISSSSNLPQKGRKENPKILEAMLDKGGIDNDYKTKEKTSLNSKDEYKHNNVSQNKKSNKKLGKSKLQLDTVSSECNAKLSSVSVHNLNEMKENSKLVNEPTKGNSKFEMQNKNYDEANSEEKPTPFSTSSNTNDRESPKVKQPLDESDSDETADLDSIKYLTPEDRVRMTKLKQYFDETSKTSSEFDVTDNAGSSPLHLAARCGSLLAVRRLVKTGADVNAVDIIGATPIMTATLSGSVKIIRALYKAGADLNKQDKLGNTPLHHAVNFNQLNAAKELQSLGSKTDIRCFLLGMTAIEVAREFGSPSILSALLKGTAKGNNS